MAERVLTVDGLCESIRDEQGRKLGRNTAYNLIASGMIRHVRTGTGKNARILIPESALDEFLAGQGPASLVASIGAAKG